MELHRLKNQWHYTVAGTVLAAIADICGGAIQGKTQTIWSVTGTPTIGEVQLDFAFGGAFLPFSLSIEAD